MKNKANEKLIEIVKIRTTKNLYDDKIDTVLFGTYEVINEEKVKVLEARIKVKIYVPMEEITEQDRASVKESIKYLKEAFESYKGKIFSNPETAERIAKERAEKEAKTYSYTRSEYGYKYKHSINISKDYFISRYKSVEALASEIGYPVDGYGMSSLKTELKGDRYLIEWVSYQNCE
jgi:hypothetical protein